MLVFSASLNGRSSVMISFNSTRWGLCFEKTTLCYQVLTLHIIMNDDAEAHFKCFRIFRRIFLRGHNSWAWRCIWTTCGEVEDFSVPRLYSAVLPNTSGQFVGLSRQCYQIFKVRAPAEFTRAKESGNNQHIPDAWIMKLIYCMWRY